MLPLAQRIERAHSAQDEELWALVRDPHPQVLLHACANRHLTEAMALHMAKARKTPVEVLGLLAEDMRFRDSYKLKLALCRNPKTMPRVSSSLLKFLRIFDLGDLTKDPSVPVILKQKIELMVQEKIPSMPSGIAAALSRRANSVIVLALLARGEIRASRACLDSPVITEAHLCEVLNRSSVRPSVVRAIAAHPKWSLRYAVRYGLIRNHHSPLARIVEFIPSMKTADLRELYGSETTPGAVRPFLFSELRERGAGPEAPEVEVFEIPEDEEDLF